MTGTARIPADSLPLLERDEQLMMLGGVLDTAGEGRGAIATIAGAAGSGKSAMLSAAIDQAHERGLAVRRARGSELELELSFGVMRQLFEPALRAASTAERARLLSGAATPAGRLFSDAPLAVAAGDGGFATLHGLYWLTSGIAAERPLVLAVDDLHWVDAPSLRAINYLAARIAELPVVLVLALRPHEPTAVDGLIEDLQSHPGILRLDLAPLGLDGVADLVRAAVPEASDELCQAFHEASAGNPFYLRELLRSVASANGLTPSATDVRQAAVTSVGDRVLKRVVRLGAGAPELAAAMSVLGASGRLRDAATVAELQVEAAAETARAMRRVEILSAEDPFEWIHPLVRQSIYEGLTVVERDLLHDRAAEVLRTAGAPPGVVAAHLSALRPHGSSSVVAGLMTAAEDALARDAPEVAVAALRRALEERAEDPPRAALLLRLGQVEVTRRNPLAAEILHEAHELSKDPRERATAAMALAEILTHDGRAQASAETIVAALAEFDGFDPELALELEVARAVIFALDPTRAAAWWDDRERLLALTDREGWGGRALAALLALTSAFRGEALGDVLALCERAVAGGRLVGERGAGAWASVHVLGALVTVEAYDRADGFADALEAAARRQGSVANAFAAQAYRGWAATRCGNLSRAEEIFRPLVEATQAGTMFLSMVTALWWMSDAILERPTQDDLATLSESLELPPAAAEEAIGGWALLVRGRVRALRGAMALAEEDLRAAGRIFGQLGFGPLHDPWRSSLALVLPAERRAEARALVDEEMVLADATGFARPRGIVRRAAGLLAGGDEGVEILRESVLLLEGSPARYEHARSLVELGSALRRSGRRTDSRGSLEAGMELAHRCGAERLVGRARQELLAAGARPRRIMRSGFNGLTASERRIVRLAAEGRSNPEIAQTLYVSLKTIETHLSNAYAKIDLSGPGARRKLPGLVAQADRASVSGVHPPAGGSERP